MTARVIEKGDRTLYYQMHKVSDKTRFTLTVTENNKIISFHPRKLTPTQQRKIFGGVLSK